MASFLLSGLDLLVSLVSSGSPTACELSPRETVLLPCALSLLVELISFALVRTREVFPGEVDSPSREVTSGEGLVPAGLSREPSLFAEETMSSLRRLFESRGAPSVALSGRWVWSTEEVDVEAGRCFSFVTELRSSGTSRLVVLVVLGDC